jgi:hypothetical protein
MGGREKKTRAFRQRFLLSFRRGTPRKLKSLRKGNQDHAKLWFLAQISAWMRCLTCSRRQWQRARRC